MKKKKFSIGKKPILVLGAIAIVLLMVSSASAVNVIQSSKMKKNLRSESCITNDAVYVDPNIRLGKNKISRLEISLDYLKNNEEWDFTEEIMLIEGIIKKIEMKGGFWVNDDDIREIIKGSSIKAVHSGFIAGKGPGICGCLPGLVGSIRGRFIPFVGPRLVATWHGWIDDYEDLRVRIRGNEYSSEHKGTALLFTGFLMNSLDTGATGYPAEFYIFGYSPLITIK